MKFRTVIDLGPGGLRIGKVAVRVIVMEVAERLRKVNLSGCVIEREVEVEVEVRPSFISSLVYF